MNVREEVRKIIESEVKDYLRTNMRYKVGDKVFLVGDVVGITADNSKEQTLLIGFDSDTVVSLRADKVFAKMASDKI